MAIIFASTVRTPEVVRAVKAGKLRKLASKLYTDDLTSSAEEIMHRHRLEIAAFATVASSGFDSSSGGSADAHYFGCGGWKNRSRDFPRAKSSTPDGGVMAAAGAGTWQRRATP